MIKKDFSDCVNYAICAGADFFILCNMDQPKGKLDLLKIQERKIMKETLRQFNLKWKIPVSKPDFIKRKTNQWWIPIVSGAIGVLLLIIITLYLKIKRLKKRWNSMKNQTIYKNIVKGKWFVS